MRIAFLTDQMIMGGGERNLASLAFSLAPYADVTVFTGNEFLANTLRAGDIGVETVHFRSRWLKFVPIRDKELEARLAEFDVAHAYSVATVPALIGHQRAVWTVHGPWEKPFGSRARIAERWLKHAIAVSSEVYGLCRFKNCPVSTVPLGSVSERVIVRAPLEEVSINAGTVRIGVLGRFQFIKGQDVALDALRLVAEKHPNYDFILQFCGGVNNDNYDDVEFHRGVKAEAVRCEIRNLLVEFEGHTSQPLDFIDKQDLILVPSRYESFSLTTIEAMSRGKPVIVPDVGGPREIIGRRLRVGLTFNPGCARSMASTIGEVLAGHRFSAAEIYSRAHYFAAERQARRHLDIYRAL